MCRWSEMQLLVPFYEGLLVQDLMLTMKKMKAGQIDLLYPTQLSAPFVAWRCKGQAWHGVSIRSLQSVPANLTLKRNGPRIELRLSCYAGCQFRSFTHKTSWQALAKQRRKHWKIVGHAQPLRQRFKQIEYYVHQWVNKKGKMPIKTDWSIQALSKRLKRSPTSSLIFPWGLSAGNIDWGGNPFWQSGAL
ncbi:MAG: hypothetical protein AAGJ35_12815, partial [Myxococcota bacterium]